MLIPLLVVLSQAEAPAVATPAPEPEVLTSEQREQKTLESINDAVKRLAEAAERMSPPPPLKVDEAPPEKVWSANFNLGATWVTGNVNSLAFVAGGGATRKTGRTIFVIKGFGGYGEATDDAGATAVLLFNAGFTAQLDYRFNDWVSIFVGGGLDTDHVKSVEVRGYGDVGAGVVWLDRKEGPAGKEWQRLYLKSDLSIRVQPESRFQYYPTLAQVDDVVSVGPRLAVAFKFGISNSTYFSQDIEVVPNVLKPRVQLNSLSKVSVGIASVLSLNAGFAVRYDSEPAAPKKNTDTVLSIGIEANL